MKTTLYLIRQGAAAGLPEASGGKEDDLPLGPTGVRQAELTRDFLAVRPLDHCYHGAAKRAATTALIIAAPHGVTPQPLPVVSLETCGEILDDLFQLHVGQHILVVAAQTEQRQYLAKLMGLSASRAAALRLDNCGISIVVRDQGKTIVHTLNASFHLQGMAA